ncbi:unnamed protein product [Sphagnum troendelagicum]|uniref:F-actin-capping protein subunit alpha n=1 Tax=Sphagnum troendelagicum TaxID=128251 RepID=A0ABP0U758_9BRYO
MEERIAERDDEIEGFEELSAEEKVAIGKWFLLKSPPGQIRQVAKDVQTVLMDDSLFTKAAEEAFPEYNVKHMIPVELPDHSGKVLVTKYAEVDNSHYLDPRTAVVATIDHIKQVCTNMRPAADDELPTALMEEYRISVDAELLKYVEEAYPGGECAVYCTCGKNVDKQEGEIELAAVISNASFSSKNFRGGSWRAVWRIQINEELHAAELQGQINVNAHYFEEGNVQLDTSYECHDSIQFQDAGDMGAGIVNVVERLESEYLSSLEDSYAKLSDRTFKELRRKLPVTRTLFSWDKALQLSLSRDLAREFTSKR